MIAGSGRGFGRCRCDHVAVDAQAPVALVEAAVADAELVAVSGKRA